MDLSLLVSAGKVIPSKVLRKLRERKLSADSLISEVSDFAGRIVDPRSRNKRVTLHDHLMCALSVFVFKQPDLLSYEGLVYEGKARENIERIFNVDNVPSDSAMREMLDEVEVSALNPIFPRLFEYARSHGALEGLRCFDDGYLLALDGTGFYSSSKVHCERCLEKHHKNGSTTYSHSMVVGALLQPGMPTVFPIGCEEIRRQDGAEKNDSERNAAARFLARIREDHPRTKFTVIEDGLSSNAPHIELLTEFRFSYILVAKPGDHKFLFKQFDDTLAQDRAEIYEWKDAAGVTHSTIFFNGLPLNESRQDVLVNFLSYWTTDKNGKELYRNTWVTDIALTEESVAQIATAGRTRWKIENETFNTLKNNGYNFGHNFGHGNKNLAGIFAILMLVAFMIDQIRVRWCRLLACLKDELKTYKGVWIAQSRALCAHAASSMTDLLAAALANRNPRLKRNTS